VTPIYLNQLKREADAKELQESIARRKKIWQDMDERAAKGELSNKAKSTVSKLKKWFCR